MFDLPSFIIAARWLAAWFLAAVFCYAFVLYPRMLWAYWTLNPSIPNYWPWVMTLTGVVALKICPIASLAAYTRYPVYLEIALMMTGMIFRSRVYRTSIKPIEWRP